MRSFRIGSAFGIPLKLDLTFLLVLPLFAWVIGSQVGFYASILNEMNAALGGAGPVLSASALTGGSLPWVLGSVAAVGLFVGVILHELGHSLTAMRYGYPIASITLWLFGGVAQLEEMPEDWKQELNIALAGPLVSVALSVVSYVAFVALPGGDGVLAPVAFVLGYLALMNVALAVFNMLPGFPMDGGRVLRALLARTRPYARATQIAAEVGKVFAFLLGLAGLFVLGNLFLVALAFFIYMGASSEAQATMTKAAFEGVVVRDIMTPAEQVITIDADESITGLISLMIRERHTGYPVTREGEIVGLVTLEDARNVREVERDAYRVEEVMTTDLITASPSDEVVDALAQLQSANVGRLLVMADTSGEWGSDSEREFIGMLTRTDIMTAFDIIRASGSLDRQDRLSGTTAPPQPDDAD